MRQAAVLDLFRGQLLPAFIAQQMRVDMLDKWLRPDQAAELTLPRKANTEHRALAKLARTPLLPLVVTTTAQALYVDGYQNPDVAADAEGWETWLANDFDARQAAIHRGALGHGTSYATILPGRDAQGPRSVMRGHSARRMVTLRGDTDVDDWPMFAVRREPSGNSWLWAVYDEYSIYYLSTDAEHRDLEFVEERRHDIGVCPVVTYANLLNLDGEAESDIEQIIPLAERFNKTVYDRLLAQHFTSWKVRTIAGLQGFADSEVEAERKKIKLAQDDILVAEDPDTKFGTLDETPLAGFIAAEQQELDTLAAVAQVPSTALSGKVANLSADAIAELRAGLAQKIFERQIAFGKAHAQALRLAHEVEGGEGSDVRARVTWRDMQPRTLAQVVDALGKMVTMLDIPAQSVWHLIPSLTRSDVEDMKVEAGRASVSAALASAADRLTGVDSS